MKEKIVEIAIRQMRLGGYENLNFANIANELQTSRANLHHHFKNKEGLGIAAVNQYIVMDKVFKASCLNGSPDDLRVGLKTLEQALAELLVETNAQNSCILPQILHDGSVPESIRKIVVARFSEEREELKTLLVNSQKKGNLVGHLDADKVANKIMINLFGVIQMALMAKSKTEIITMMDEALTSCLQ